MLLLEYGIIIESLKISIGSNKKVIKFWRQLQIFGKVESKKMNRDFIILIMLLQQTNGLKMLMMMLLLMQLQ